MWLKKDPEKTQSVVDCWYRAQDLPIAESPLYHMNYECSINLLSSLRDNVVQRPNFAMEKRRVEGRNHGPYIGSIQSFTCCNWRNLLKALVKMAVMSRIETSLSSSVLTRNHWPAHSGIYKQDEGVLSLPSFMVNLVEDIYYSFHLYTREVFRHYKRYRDKIRESWQISPSIEIKEIKM